MSQVESRYWFEFKLDLQLLNILRQFTHNDHEFPEGYLESIYALLYYYQGKPESELFSEYSAQNGNHSIESLIFQVHFYIASLANLGVLIKSLGMDEAKVQNLKSDINKTNILSVHAITDRVGQINHGVLIQKSSTIKPEYLNLTVKIATFPCETEMLLIDYNQLSLAIQAKGKLDPYLSSHIAAQLNTRYKIDLVHVLLAYSEDRAKITKSYGDRFEMIFKGVHGFRFRKDKFKEYRTKLVQLSSGVQVEEIRKILGDLDAEVGKSIIARDLQSSAYLEKLLIGLLGNPIQLIRDQAVVCLNILFDGVDWQKRSPYRPKISKVGSKFVIEYLFEWDQQPLSQLVLLLKSYIADPGCKQNIVSWHKPKFREYYAQGDRRYIAFTMDFGRFRRCGFYDWKLVKLSTSGQLQAIYKIVNQDSENAVETKPIQGRFIVHPADAKKLQVHEIYVDLLDVKPDSQGKFSKRGNFRKVAEKIPEFSNAGINCIYLMGALERDNGLTVDEASQQKIFKRPDVSPLAITDRFTPNTMLGGKLEFQNLTKIAKQQHVRILIDSLTRISSARPHHKYKKHRVHKLDTQNKLVAMFGTDGRSLSFEDTFVLNHRKKKVWDMLLTEIVEFAYEHEITGVHLDNGQAWPQIFTLDTHEMYRKESDGTPAYSEKEIFSGMVCIENEDCGYWGSSVKNTYPNPFLIKICKHIWRRLPNFLIVAETWGSLGENEERELNIIQSGPIPRLFRLPIAIASIFGESLKKDGTVTKTERKNVNVIRKWIEQTNKQYPRGSILIQSTTYNAWPYPALIFKRGTWAAVDLFFLLPDIPMTFMGEEQGYAFREKTTNVFSYIGKYNNAEIPLQDPTLQAPKRRLKKIESYIQSDDLGFGYNVQEPITVSIVPQTQSGVLRVQSGTSLSQMEMAHIANAQENFRKEVGPEFGFDLSLIGQHYKHRRQLRKDHRVLRNGALVSLSAEHIYGWHTHVLAFARYSKDEMVLIAINFNDGEIDMFMNLNNLRYYFPNFENSNIVVRLRDWSNPASEIEETSYYYIGEFLTERLTTHLKNFQTQIWGVEISTDGSQCLLAEKSSLMRLKQKLTNMETIYGNDQARQLVLLTEHSKSLQYFINRFSEFYEVVIDKNQFELNKLISQMRVFQTNKPLLCKLFAYFHSIVRTEAKNLKIFEPLEKLIGANKLGPIVFCTPELGKWTTTGGLGVMVDELTQELAKMNEEIYIITPYYHKNKKGETGYLAADGFEYVNNIDIWLEGQKCTFGVTEGISNGVKIFWLHNVDFFPSAYCGEAALYVMKQLTAYAKGCLELLCQRKLIPSVIVTNDWFCGLIPGYLRVKRYGEVFVGTKSFHIVHNLDPLYEGRLYPKPDEGNLSYIHELPNEYFVDPFWTQLVINPSRCPLMTCDNWGTVSESYKYELLAQSPLAPFLRAFKNPFAFPNGIRRAQRLKLIVEKTGNDHLKAKEMLQKKYFGCKELEDDIPIFGFVGRVTKQKGVHLILSIAEDLIRNSHGKVQILVGGPADFKEEYSAQCANEMHRLRQIYPRNFWADPSLFFQDGTVVNVGCDFALMPSAFEPGGIVQHEFFIGSTPVVAFKTGGLRDTVFEYDQKQQKGSGFIFEHYTRHDFLASIQRAISIYNNKPQYSQLRKNAFEAAIDVADVGRAWAQEFYRLFEKNYIDKEYIQQMMEQINHDYVELKQAKLFDKEEGRVFKNQDKVTKEFDAILVHARKSNAVQHTFTYRTSKIPQPRSVSVSGSFDEWKLKHKLKFDHFAKVWNITLQLHRGEYFFKFQVDNDWVCSEDDLKDNDIYGNINNFVIIE